MHIAVIGGGAAGFFGAIRCAELHRNALVHLFEKSGKLLSKVRVSGGGRCNVTHACHENLRLVQHYPRGHKELRGPFEQFSVKDTIAWYQKRGVRLKTEADGRMFPVTDDSETIASCLEEAASEAGIKIRLHTGVSKLQPLEGGGFNLYTSRPEPEYFDKVLVAAGGGTKPEHFDWLAELGHRIVPPVPSLFTFNIPDKTLHALAGVSVSPVKVEILQTKFQETGPLLITHWGLSGPAILKLSAWAARELHEMGYQFSVRINFVPQLKEEELRQQLLKIKELEPRKQLGSIALFELPHRLWRWLLEHSQINPELRWADFPKKELNRLVNNLYGLVLQAKGKSTNKEEFVTAGGVSLKDIELKTMESKKVPGLFFAGEVMDIDGITGGFNFQAAWTTSWIAGSNMGK